jgi:hypothetical protein
MKALANIFYFARLRDAPLTKSRNSCSSSSSKQFLNMEFRISARRSPAPFRSDVSLTTLKPWLLTKVAFFPPLLGGRSTFPPSSVSLSMSLSSLSEPLRWTNRFRRGLQYLTLPGHPYRALLRVSSQPPHLTTMIATSELIRPIERSDDVPEEDPWERSTCRGRGEWMMVGRIGRSMVPRASNLSYLTVLSTLLFVIFI